MKASIIIFSPTGNTLSIGKIMMEELEKAGVKTSLLNISDDQYFKAPNKAEYLQNTIPSHDVLIVGAPVYAHHLQFHMKDLLSLLPKPDKKWGNFVIPFITYGGISSGITLEEAAKILNKRKRRVVTAAKFSVTHHALQNFINTHVGFESSESEIEKEISKLVKKVCSLNNDSPNISRKLTYRSRKEFLIDNIVFNEKAWHKNRYPEMSIDQSTCTQCQRCVKSCPVSHPKLEGKSVQKDSECLCIHCTSCILHCPSGAISPKGDLEKMENFVGKLLSKGAEQPKTEVF